MLEKTYVESRRVWKVTFELPRERLPRDVEVECIHLAGDFNDWDTTALPMSPGKDGAFRATVELAPGRDYAFRYLLNGEHWLNDWEADAYVPSSFGWDNCIVEAPQSA